MKSFCKKWIEELTAVFLWISYQDLCIFWFIGSSMKIRIILGYELKIFAQFIVFFKAMFSLNLLLSKIALVIFVKWSLKGFCYILFKYQLLGSKGYILTSKNVQMLNFYIYPIWKSKWSILPLFEWPKLQILWKLDHRAELSFLSIYFIDPTTNSIFLKTLFISL